MKIHELVEGVEYKCGDGIYRKAVDGFFEVRTSSGEWTECYAPYNTIIGMEFEECEFQPKEGEMFYYPSFEGENGYSWCYWYEGEYCEKAKRLVGAYRTKEQAIQKAKELGWFE